MKKIRLHPVKSKEKKEISSLFLTNIITCNKTKPDGSVVNQLEENAELARHRVDNIRL